MSSAECLACKSRRNHPLHYWKSVPLSVLGLPRTEQEARHMSSFVMDLRQCAMCGHVFHTEFDYEKIPYRTGSNLVFNRAHYWQVYQEELAKDWIARLDLSGKTVVEIGCGEGLFLKPFVEAGCRCIAFEPGPDAKTAQGLGIETHQEYFQASRLFELRPDAIICRHVLEHLSDPLDFLQDIALVCQEVGIRPAFLGEVPQIDKALEQCRINDFLYEHVSNFTRDSFRVMFEHAGFEVSEVVSRYDDEVVTIVARPRQGGAHEAIREQAESFRRNIAAHRTNVGNAVAQWARAGVKVALWGGTGKAASMINTFDLTKEQFPLVIDSDLRKAGSFVPGTGQCIQGPGALAEDCPDLILICTQWRARDIEREIREDLGLDVPLYVYHCGDLVELNEDTRL